MYNRDGKKSIIIIIIQRRQQNVYIYSIQHDKNVDGIGHIVHTQQKFIYFCFFLLSHRIK